MSDRIANHIDETLIHKQFVLESARILSKHLIENGQLSKAIELVSRCSVHDDSKFSEEEITAFIRIENKESLKNPKAPLDDATKESLKVHWQNNRHHPEYHSDIRNMTEIDLMEMACDCAARSMQYETNLMEFIQVRQEERFHFPLDMYAKFNSYCQILVSGTKEISEASKVYYLKKNA